MMSHMLVWFSHHCCCSIIGTLHICTSVDGHLCDLALKRYFCMVACCLQGLECWAITRPETTLDAVQVTLRL